MSRKEKTIFTNMCMVYDDNGNVLVQNRMNPDWPGITFPGGHVDAGESFTDAVIREVFEDAFDSIITDWDCVEDQIAAIEERGVEITVVEEPK